MDEITPLIEKVQEKHDEWALETAAAGDYVTLPCGLRLLKPTLPHAWAIARLSHFLAKDPYRLNVITAWLLCHEQKTVRSELMPRLTPNNADALEAEAEGFLIDNGADPMDVMTAVATLTEEAFAKKKRERES